MSLFARTACGAAVLALLTACGGSGGGGTTPPPTGGSPVQVSGTLSYEFPPPNPGCRGLNFSATLTRPIRGATVQLVRDSDGSLQASTTASDSGSYSFASVAANTNFRIRVLAELKKSGASPTWDVEVRDNVDTSANPEPLTSRPQYALDGATFNTRSSNRTVNLTAETGWTGASYGADRAAAPFAILDVAYTGMQYVLQGEPNLDFPELDIYWSVNNKVAPDFDIDNGEAPVSYYSNDPDEDGIVNRSMVLQGDAVADTEEFDDHVVLHEWGHYFHNFTGRSDSIGGSHALGERIDARLAWGEGWPTAFASVVFDEPQYCDTFRPASSGFGINAESDIYGKRGWYNEVDVITFLYDLLDENADGNDSLALGWESVHGTMTDALVATDAFVTVHSFAAELRPSLSPAEQAALDTLLEDRDINSAGLDIWGSTEDNDANDAGSAEVLPIYTDIQPNGTPLNICTTSEFDNGRDGNNVGEYRYLRLEITDPRPYRFEVATVGVGELQTPPSTPAPGFDCVALYEANPDDPLTHTYSDPDFGLFLKEEQVWGGYSCNANSEITVSNELLEGTYIMDVTDYRHADDDTVGPYPERVCYDITVTPN
ncbi:MAG: carboxypeptidase-like regulatory domain-containing protein [Woeseiaceae bacterium]